MRRPFRTPGRCRLKRFRMARVCNPDGMIARFKLCLPRPSICLFLASVSSHYLSPAAGSAFPDENSLCFKRLRACLLHLSLFSAASELSGAPQGGCQCAGLGSAFQTGCGMHADEIIQRESGEFYKAKFLHKIINSPKPKKSLIF